MTVLPRPSAAATTPSLTLKARDRHSGALQLAEPFDTLLSEEIRLAAARRAHLELIDAIDDVFRAGDGDTPLEPELALAGALTSPASPTALRAQGLKEKILVDLGSHTTNRSPIIEGLVVGLG
jgi:hypothetical protein